MATDSTLSLIAEAYAAVEHGDLQPLMAMLTEEVVWVDSTLGPLAGAYTKEEVPEFFARMMEVYGGSLQVEITGMLADDVRGVVLTKESGTSQGETVAWTGVHVWSFHHGKATRFTNYGSGEYQHFWAERPHVARRNGAR